MAPTNSFVGVTLFFNEDTTMKQYEAVIKVMEENGGFATLGFLNQNVLKVKNCEWKSKTPFASIRRIVQDERFFFKIKPGLWALKSFKERLPSDVYPTETQPKEKQEEYNHSYYQGLIVEIGNFKKFKTFVPNQDKNKLFLGRKLTEITTVHNIFKFTYDHIIQKAQTIDVTWFNERNMPENLFEIEYSTQIQNSLLKFVELQDFYSKFFIVADVVRENEFKDKLYLAAFKPIYDRVKFWSYNDVADLHSYTSKSTIIELKLGL